MTNLFYSFSWAALLGLLLGSSHLAYAQVGIGTPTPDASAALDIVSSSKGVLLPRVASVTAISSPAPGLLAYQTGAPAGYYYYTGTGWQQLVPASGTNFIRNQTSQQAASSFNVSGSGTVGGTLTAASAVVTTALTGSGTSIGSVVGVGIRADGGLNLGQNTTGNSIYLGYQAGRVNTGPYNVFVGYQSGYSNTTGSSNLFSGTQAGYANTTGTDNLFSGGSSGSSNTTGSRNLFSGTNSGYANTTGSDNLFSGFNSGRNNTTGGGNIFSGSFSGANNTTGSDNQFSGFACGVNNTTGTHNLFSGSYSGQSNTTGSDNLFSGFNSGYSNTTGRNNLFSGSYSGQANTTGSNNVFSGYQSGYSNTTGDSNVFNGYLSGYANTTGSNNQFSGFYSGYYSTTGSNNLFSGSESGYSNGTGNDNVFIGYSSGQNNSTGSNNVFSGSHSGLGNGTGSNNTALGYNSGPAGGSGALTNATAIGANASVSQSNSVVLGSGASVGIGSSAPAARLTVQVASDNERGIQVGDNSSTGNLVLQALSGGNAGYAFLGFNGYVSSCCEQRINAAKNRWRLGVDQRGSGDGFFVDTYNGTTITPVLAATTAGDVGIGTDTPSYRLDVNGTIRGANVSPSDRRFKTDVRPLTGALASVLALRGVRYRWNALGVAHGGKAGAGQVGLIAQEVEQVYPELVNTDKEGYKSVNYAQLTPVLIEALKEQQRRLEVLQRQAAQAEADHATLLTLQAQLARLLGQEARAQK